MVAWFKQSMLVSEWMPVDQPCPITKMLVPFKNGFYKSVPIVNNKRQADSDRDSPAKRQKVE